MAADGRTLGERAADVASAILGSWKFIIVQTIIVVSWITLNVIVLTHGWDPYPFILLNLSFSTQAAYAAPLLQLASNRAKAAREALEDQQAERQLAMMHTIHALVETVRADVLARDKGIDDQLEEIHDDLQVFLDRGLASGAAHDAHDAGEQE